MTIILQYNFNNFYIFSNLFFLNYVEWYSCVLYVCDFFILEETVICGTRTGWSSLRRFLVSAGVEDYAPTLLDQRIDLEALLMLSEQDLVQLGQWSVSCYISGHFIKNRLKSHQNETENQLEWIQTSLIINKIYGVHGWNKNYNSSAPTFQVIYTHHQG